MDPNLNICRLCLKIINEESTLTPLINNSAVLQTLNLISFATIKNLQLTEDPVICGFCINKLKNLACFKENIITNEFKIQCLQKKDVNSFLRSLSEDINKICRLCLKTSADNNVFQRTWRENKKMFVKCNIRLNMHIANPAKMCDNCFRTLEAMFNFVCDCVDKEKKIVSSHSTKKGLLEAKDLFDILNSQEEMNDSKDDGKNMKDDLPKIDDTEDNNNLKGNQYKLQSKLGNQRLKKSRKISSKKVKKQVKPMLRKGKKSFVYNRMSNKVNFKGRLNNKVKTLKKEKTDSHNVDTQSKNIKKSLLPLTKVLHFDEKHKFIPKLRSGTRMKKLSLKVVRNSGTMQKNDVESMVASEDNPVKLSPKNKDITNIVKIKGNVVVNKTAILKEMVEGFQNRSQFVQMAKYIESPKKNEEESDEDLDLSDDSFEETNVGFKPSKEEIARKQKAIEEVSKIAAEWSSDEDHEVEETDMCKNRASSKKVEIADTKKSLVDDERQRLIDILEGNLESLDINDHDIGAIGEKDKLPSKDLDREHLLKILEGEESEITIMETEITESNMGRKEVRKLKEVRKSIRLKNLQEEESFVPESTKQKDGKHLEFTNSVREEASNSSGNFVQRIRKSPRKIFEEVMCQNVNTYFGKTLSTKKSITNTNLDSREDPKVRQNIDDHDIRECWSSLEKKGSQSDDVSDKDEGKLTIEEGSVEVRKSPRTRCPDRKGSNCHYTSEKDKNNEQSSRADNVCENKEELVNKGGVRKKGIEKTIKRDNAKKNDENIDKPNDLVPAAVKRSKRLAAREKIDVKDVVPKKRFKNMSPEKNGQTNEENVVNSKITEETVAARKKYNRKSEKSQDDQEPVIGKKRTVDKKPPLNSKYSQESTDNALPDVTHDKPVFLTIIRRTRHNKKKEEAERKWQELMGNKLPDSHAVTEKLVKPKRIRLVEGEEDDYVPKKRGRKPKPISPEILTKITILDVPESENSSPNKELFLNCQQCPYKTKSQDRLMQHRMIHTVLDDVLKFRCQKCPFRAKSQDALDQHGTVHVDMHLIYKCIFCDVKSKKKVSIMNHTVLHSDKDLEGLFYCFVKNEDIFDEFFECFQCDYQSSDESSIPQHLRDHKKTTKVWNVNPAMFACKNCPYKTKSAERLQRHEFAHTEQYQHKIKKRGGVSVKMEMKEETQDKSKEESVETILRCKLCSFATLRKRSLINHVTLKHNRTRNPNVVKKPENGEQQLYYCDKCSYVTHRKTNMPRHVLVHRTKENLEFFECSQCLFETKHRRSYTRHMETIHGITV